VQHFVTDTQKIHKHTHPLLTDTHNVTIQNQHTSHVDSRMKSSKSFF